MNTARHKDELIITTGQLAEGYECTPRHIKQNFNNNKGWFTEGEHFYFLENSELKAFKSWVDDIDLVDKHTRSLYLWTKRGDALLLIVIVAANLCLLCRQARKILSKQRNNIGCTQLTTKYEAKL